MRLTGCVALTLAAALNLGCKTTQGGSTVAATVAASDGTFAGMAQAAAASLRTKYNAYEIQTFTDPPQDCRTIITPADPTVPFRGTAVFYHGHTACPQQFYEISQILAKKGVQSFIPLMPGQGRAPQPTAALGGKVNGVAFKDYYGEFLPKVENSGWQDLGHFVDDVNSFIASVPGDHFVAGLSVGGMLATYAYVSQPNLYKTALIMNPYYGMPGNYAGQDLATQGVLSPVYAAAGDGLYYIQKGLLDVASQAISSVAGLPVTWGASCYSEATPSAGIGRAGICDFRFDNLAAVDAFGRNLLVNYLEKLPATSTTVVQYMMREFDDGANTLLTRKAQALQQKAWGSTQVNFCTLSNAVPHSFFARPDLISIQEPYWLNGFLKNGSNHIALGSPYPIDSSRQSQEVVMDPTTFKDTKTFLSRCDTTEIAYTDVYLTE